MNRDPLEDFFARERADVRELPAGEERWEAMVAESRRPHRRGALLWLGAAAAAAVVAGSVVVGTGNVPDLQTASDTPTRTVATTSGTPQPTVTVTRTVQPGPPATGEATTSSPSRTTPASKILPVPVGFGLASMTNAGGGHLYALGAGVCATGDCTAVVGSDDNGRTWSTRASFTDLTTRGPLVTPAGPHQLVGVRFANPQVGYVFGTEVRRTTDGGRSWTPVDVGGRTVLSLETDGSRVWMATAARCTHQGAAATLGCSDLQVRTGSVTDRTTTAVRVEGLAKVVENAWIAMDGPDAYLNGTSTGAQQPLPAIRVSGTPTALPVPEGCDPSQGLTLAATANTRGTLVGLCPSADAPDSRWTVVTSTDRGGSWRSRPAPGLGTPTRAGVWLTATDATHLVAVRQALPASTGEVPSPTTMLASSTGGAAWAPVAPGGSTDTAWAGAAGGGLVYAFSGGGSYWLSTDAGSTFETVPLRR
ncbi:hypothetical protein [Phycicoccus sp. Root101]|uniref:WD40/YVTN/BNR-like repeat-containing protein n=1 Tax=Phycicoccus sp. Root101 TaxID=1736421 RepID=UPI0007034FB5|nr:hypothetical protein [Phycicoccus sp. Root101]KQU70295.1 hypothetical protein ASC58_00185 [Phycicoccus sp. Root101]